MYLQKTQKVLFSIFSLFVLFLLINVEAISRPVVFKGECRSCDPPTSGTYVWSHINGKPVTSFYPDDINQNPVQNVPGYGTFIISGGGENGNPFDPNNPMDIANTTFTNQMDFVTLSTDKPVKIAIVDLSTYSFITDLIEVANTVDIPMAGFPTGCRYNLIVYQEVEPGLIIAITNYMFCKER